MSVTKSKILKNLKVTKIKSLFLCTFIIILTLVMTEMILRVMVCLNAENISLLFKTVVHQTKIVRADPVLNHVLIPNIKFTHTGRLPGLEYVTVSQINSTGQHDHEIPPKKQNEKRILILGDSFVEAMQVPMDKNFCKRLEKHLNQNLSVPVTVINAGVASYSPLLELLYYEQRLKTFKSDIVIQLIFSNDVYDDLRYTDLAEYAHGVPCRVPPGDPNPKIFTNQSGTLDYKIALYGCLRYFKTPLNQYSYLSTLITYLLAMRCFHKQFPTPPENDQLFVLYNDPKFEELKKQGWALTSQYIRALKKASERDGARFILACAPFGGQIYKKVRFDKFFSNQVLNTDDQEQVKQIAQKSGADFIDLLGPLKAGGTGLYFHRDGHWTPKAHKIVADSFYNYVYKIINDSL